ncbi:MAG: hypothetical protein RLZZ385_1136 [Pseudomonadota bacterium]
MKTRCITLLMIMSLFLPVLAEAQALTSLASLRVRYNSQKARIQPEGELKVLIDQVDAALADASRQGATGEVRRLLAQGSLLLNGGAWTPEADFANSLVLRSDRVVVDPAQAYALRLEQIYRPDIVLEQPLSAVASLLPAAAAQSQAQQAVKTFPPVNGVSRDLRESPQFFELDLSGVPDGNYTLRVAVSADGRELGDARLSLAVRNGLNDLVAKLEQGAAAAPPAVRADILYPVDRMRQVNRGRLELRTFDPAADFAAAEAVLAASQSGGDPFSDRRGDFKRHYLLESAGEIMPYRVYVPSGYDANRAWPLVIALHGLGGTENSFFDNYDQDFPPLAEQHGYLVAAPLGYRVDGSYGWGLGSPPADPNTRIVQQHSEEDVMQVLARMQEHYNIDPRRIYLAGHSMGAIGTWKIAAKYPDLWAAIGMFAGSGNPDTMEAMQHIPQYVVHGDADPTVNVRGSRMMVSRMRELEMTHVYHEIPGGDHGNVVAPGFPGLFEFFDQYAK